jgi:O-antigen/teichoic acid export membrane protein
MASLHHSLIFSFGEKYALVAINFATMAIVSRLFTPREFGIFAIATALMMTLEALREFGVGAYLIQRRDLSAADIQAAFTLTLLSSLLFAAILLAASGPIAAFYQEEVLTDVLRISALGLLLLPVQVPVMALLRRDFAFDILALVSVIGALTNLGAIVLLTALGFGVMSLAWAGLASAAAAIMLALWLRPRFDIFRFSLHRWREMLSFGSYASATALLNVLAQSFLPILLGRLLGLGATGLYTRATTLSRLFDRLILDALHPIMLPVLAQQVRAGGDLKRAYLHALTLMTAVYWPALIFLALTADPIVRLLLGSQWLEVAVLVRILALAALCLFPAFLTYPILVATGRIRDTLISSLISIPLTLAITGAAATLGVTAAAAACFLTYPLQVAVALHFVRRQVPFTGAELAAALWRSALVALCAAAPPASVVALAGFRFDLSLWQMAGAALGALAAWFGLMLALRHPLLDEMRDVAGTAWRSLLARAA